MTSLCSGFNLANLSSLKPWGKNYDVYVNCRREARSPFVDALYTEFKKQHLKVFPGNVRRSRCRLMAAVKNSSTAVAVLENNYATSSWCLDELVNIIESHGQKKTVLPVFYNVDPSDVRNQTGSFAEAFARHEETYKDDPEKVRRWRAALTQVASLAGWDSRGRQESELIKEIVDDIWRKLHPMAKTSTPYSSPFSSQRWRYNVFMCFRGKDTRLNIVGHMYTSLEQKGITTFKDDKKLERGLSLSSGIVKAIDESQISLVTLSENFASSTWCLDELVKILECTETSNLQRILEAFTENEEAFADMAGIKCNTRNRKKNELRVLVNYDGKWANSIYSGGKTKGIMVSDSITYEELVQRLYNILGVDPSEYKIIIRTAYASTLPTQPVELTHDGDVRFFIDENLDMGSKIPLCITLRRQCNRWNHLFSSLFAHWVS